MILTSRGIMAIVVLTLPFFYFFFQLNGIIKVNKKINIFFFLVLFCLLAIIIYEWDFFYTYIEMFGEGFNSQTDKVRFNQRTFLYNAWLESPVLGHGYGVMFYEHERGFYSSNFESQYHYELAATGIIGMSIFCIYNFMITQQLYKYFLHNRVAISYLIGYFYFLIATATNPFLSTFDRLLPLYLCIAIINLYHKEINEKRCFNSFIYL